MVLQCISNYKSNAAANIPRARERERGWSEGNANSMQNISCYVNPLL